jgi:hypothetical protein
MPIQTDSKDRQEHLKTPVNFHTVHSVAKFAFFAISSYKAKVSGSIPLAPTTKTYIEGEPWFAFFVAGASALCLIFSATTSSS